MGWGLSTQVGRISSCPALVCRNSWQGVGSWRGPEGWLCPLWLKISCTSPWLEIPVPFLRIHGSQLSYSQKMEAARFPSCMTLISVGRVASERARGQYGIDLRVGAMRLFLLSQACHSLVIRAGWGSTQRKLPPSSVLHLPALGPEPSCS